MRLVVDANILVAELIRVRGRKLIAHPELKLFMAEKAWEEANYELIDTPATRRGGFLSLSDWVCLDSKQALSPRPDSPPQAIELSFCLNYRLPDG